MIISMSLCSLERKKHVHSCPLWLYTEQCIYFRRMFQIPVLLQLLGVHHSEKSDAYFDNMETGTKVRTLQKMFTFLSDRSFPCGFSKGSESYFSSQNLYTVEFKSSIFCPSHLWFPTFSSAIVHLLRLQLGFHTLTYFIYQKTLKLLWHLFWNR